MILDLITGTVGLSFIDENMGEIITALGNGGPQFGILGLARNLAILLALGVGAYESYMMMLGRRGMDVMKILRVIIIAICISQSSWIAGQLKSPGRGMERQARVSMQKQNAILEAKEKEVREAQDDFIKKMFLHLDSIRGSQKAEALKDKNAIVDTNDYIEEIGKDVGNWFKKAAIWLEVNVANALNYVIRWLSEVIFQVMFYGILITQKVVLNLMTQFLPLAFALSLAPPFKSAWSQYISKFLTVTLWAPIAYTMVIYVDSILYYTLSNDAASLLVIKDMDWGEIGGLGLNMIGTTVTYATGMFVGAKMISMTTEIAGWLIPGGMSSGMGGAMTGAVMGATVSNAVSSSKTIGSTVTGGLGSVGRTASSVGSTVGGAVVGALSGSPAGVARGATSGLKGSLQSFRGVGSDTPKPNPPSSSKSNPPSRSK